MNLAVEVILLQNADQDAVGDPIAIETEAIGSWIWLAVVTHGHAVVRSGRVGDASSEGLRQDRAIVSHHTAFGIDVELGERHFL